LRALQPFWREEMARNAPRASGKIKTLLEDRAGFIHADDGSDIYFQTRDILGSRSALKPGTKVTFTTVDSFDRKKGKVSSRAEQVRVEE